MAICEICRSEAENDLSEWVCMEYCDVCGTNYHSDCLNEITKREPYLKGKCPNCELYLLSPQEILAYAEKKYELGDLEEKIRSEFQTYDNFVEFLKSS